MDFLVVLIAYLVSISLSSYDEPFTEWTLGWRRLTARIKLNRALALAVYLLAPVVLLAAVLWFFSNSLVSFVCSLALLLLVFRSGDQPEKLAEYQAKVDQGDEQAAWQIAVDSLGLESQMYQPGDDGIDEGVQAGLGYLFLERFFVPVFWFIAFGAPGVLLVWLTSALMRDEQVDAFCHKVKHALYWIPVRAMAITTALVGSFSHCFPVWTQQSKDFDSDDRVLLVRCMQSAICQADECDMLSETLKLLKRTQFAWLVMLGFWLLFSI
ncbi:regulatory signaling modulator protein AmpE [Reinekea thalattae]|uniref:Regulatory signaling modulator protein AmpE n=1 Tax=Reinekea thalattae TaxID=2593301 RepID=A0A5C8Z8L0_9GAMM|nr:regulatory signaling modulator protein AmpE [Reinekea thalattae]TXR54262.1 hypothetical protein FME95_06925 [Reinekea thalattae]